MFIFITIELIQSRNYWIPAIKDRHLYEWDVRYIHYNYRLNIFPHLSHTCYRSYIFISFIRTSPSTNANKLTLNQKPLPISILIFTAKFQRNFYKMQKNQLAHSTAPIQHIARCTLCTSRRFLRLASAEKSISRGRESTSIACLKFLREDGIQGRRWYGHWQKRGGVSMVERGLMRNRIRSYRWNFSQVHLSAGSAASLVLESVVCIAVNRPERSRERKRERIRKGAGGRGKRAMRERPVRWRNVTWSVPSGADVARPITISRGEFSVTL